MALNQSLVGILRLLIAYEWQETLSHDEFSAIDHYQALGYRLRSESVYEGDEPLEDSAPDILCQQVLKFWDGERIYYYLVKDGEQ